MILVKKERLEKDTHQTAIRVRRIAANPVIYGKLARKVATGTNKACRRGTQCPEPIEKSKKVEEYLDPVQTLTESAQIEQKSEKIESCACTCLISKKGAKSLRLPLFFVF